MTSAGLQAFLLGAIVLGCAIAGVLFARFRRDTGDRLFAFLAAAFWLLALHYGLLALTAPESEHRPLFYLLRLSAFLTILFGILDKNRHARRPPGVRAP